MSMSGRRSWLSVGALALALVVVGLDVTVLNLALPTLAGTLKSSTTQLQWMIDSYSLVVAAMLLPAGLLGDRFGRKKMLVIALVLFGIASVACAYSGSAGMLIAARGALGLGAAFVFPLALSVLPVIFGEEERTRAVTILLGATVAAYPIGPILGGWLLTHFWWGSVFLINVPVVVLAVVAVAILMPESRSAERARFDAIGVAASSLGLALVTFGVIRAGEAGLSDPAALAILAAGVALLAAFVTWERKITSRGSGQPLVDLELFRSVRFTSGTVLATLVFFAMFGLLFTAPQYFQAVRGTDAVGAGLRLLPVIGGLLAGAGAADRLASRAGTKTTVALGFAVLAAGLFLGGTTSLHSGDGFAIAWVAIVGVGLGLALPSTMDAALGSLSAERSGVGSALIQAVRQVGGTFGVAILGSVLNAAYRSRLAPGTAPIIRRSVSAAVAIANSIGSKALLNEARAAFVHGMDMMLLVCGVTVAAGVALTLIWLPSRAGVPRAPEASRNAPDNPVQADLPVPEDSPAVSAAR